MQIGELARRVGTTTHAVRYYERHGLVPGPRRKPSGYRDYSEADVERLRLMVGLRQLDLPPAQAAELSSLCAEGRCQDVSAELRETIRRKRADLRARVTAMESIDRRLAHLEGDLAAGLPPRPLIMPRKEADHADAL